VHLETLFRDRREPPEAGGVSDLAVELHALRLERLSPPIQIAKRARLVDAVRPPSNDARGHEDETKK
jgi:hypothetical protein